MLDVRAVGRDQGDAVVERLPIKEIARRTGLLAQHDSRRASQREAPQLRSPPGAAVEAGSVQGRDPRAAADERAAGSRAGASAS